MALVVNTNLASIAAQRLANESANKMQNAMERLSSGKRINSAADDAAGSAIATRMDSLIRAHEMGKRNIQDGISMIQTADGALSTQRDMLQRMRELTIQSANGTNSASERVAINNEMDALKSQMNTIANSTKFNGKELLNGSYMKSDIQTGGDYSNQIALGFGNTQISALGVYETSTQYLYKTGVEFNDTFYDDYNDFMVADSDNSGITDTYYQNGLQTNTAFSVDIAGAPIMNLDLEAGNEATGKYFGQRFEVEKNSQLADVAAMINSGDTGIKATAVNKFQLWLDVAETTAVPCAALADEDIANATFYLQSGNGQGAIEVNVARLYDQELFAADFAEGVNAYSGKTGITAEVQSDGRSVYISQTDGYDVRVSMGVYANDAVFKFAETELNDDRFFSESTDEATTTTLTVETFLTITGTTAMLPSASNTFVSSGRLVFSADQAFILNDEGDEGAQGTGVGYLMDESDATLNKKSANHSSLGQTNVLSQEDAMFTLRVIDAAIGQVTRQQTNLGAIENRLEFAASFADNQIIHQSAAKSRIEDADFAKESSNLAKQQILQQVSTAMLAQANAQPNVVLSLLGG
jgi:flagellin